MRKKFIKTFIISLLLFAVVFFGASKILDIMEITSKVEFLGSDLADGNVIEQSVENELLFLVLGLDSDDFSGATTEQNRTDTMILAKVNFEKGTVDMLSIPRDSRVLVNGRYDKINHAHHFGGLKLALKTTRDFLGLDIDYYVRVNFFSVKDIVDALGGVEVDVPVRVDVAEDNVHLNPGLQTLNGKQALQFARFRAGYPEGDLGRVKSQQILIKALLKELVKPKNIAKIPKLLDVIKRTVNTNIPFSKIAKYALKAGNLSTDRFNAKIVPGEGQTIDNISYYVPNRMLLNKILKETFSDYIIKGGAAQKNEGPVDNYNRNNVNRQTTPNNQNIQNNQNDQNNVNRENNQNSKNNQNNQNTQNNQNNVNNQNTQNNQNNVNNQNNQNTQNNQNNVNNQNNQNTQNNQNNVNNQNNNNNNSNNN